MEKIKLAITDDHALVRDGIKSLLSGVEEVSFIASYENGAETISGLLKETPDVLFLDINLPDTSGIDLCKKIKHDFSGVQIIALSSHSEPTVVKSILKAGASGYLSKNTSKTEILSAIKEVLSDSTFLSSDIQQLIISDSLGMKKQSSAIDRLTKREQEVLECIADELTTAEISEKLFISTKTVETHRMNLLQKLGVKNSVGLVKKAMENGLI